MTCYIFNRIHNKSAHRALGLLISKVKLNGGVPYECFVKLYDSLVWSVINYGASIWGTRVYPAIEAVHNRACRFFLGVGQRAPTAAVRGDMGMLPPLCRQHGEVARQYSRLENMAVERVNRRVFNWAVNTTRTRAKGWPGRVNKMMVGLGITNRDVMGYGHDFIMAVKDASFIKFLETWNAELNRVHAKKGPGGNKLRTYRLFKSGFKAEPYVLNVRTIKARSCMAKFRCGTPPINIELGRYISVPANERFCNFCQDMVEDEAHVILHCSLYNSVRNDLFTHAVYLNDNFMSLNDNAKLHYLFTNSHISVKCAKTCQNILSIRNNATTK